MKKISQEEFSELSTIECVTELECTHTRKCGWRGLENQLTAKRISEVESSMVCPHCGNDETYFHYIPTYKAASKYVKQEES